jgi:hypothetical protein
MGRIIFGSGFSSDAFASMFAFVLVRVSLCSMRLDKPTSKTYTTNERVSIRDTALRRTRCLIDLHFQVALHNLLVLPSCSIRPTVND